MNNLQKRKNIRLEEYDYSTAGAYFVTICVNKRYAVLWENVGADIIRPLTTDFDNYLSEYGEIVKKAIENIPLYHPTAEVKKYCIMPDHIHLIVFLNCNNGRIISAPTLSTIIGSMKRWVSKQAGFPIWQKSFYDTIIRNEKMYLEIWKYIDENPLHVDEDIIEY